MRSAPVHATGMNFLNQFNPVNQRSRLRSDGGANWSRRCTTLDWEDERSRFHVTEEAIEVRRLTGPRASSQF